MKNMGKARMVPVFGIIFMMIIGMLFVGCGDDPKDSLFVSTTNSDTANDIATLGLVGTSAVSSNPGVATVISPPTEGKIKITSVSEGEAVITVLDADDHEATIDVTVSAIGDIDIGTIVKYLTPNQLSGTAVIKSPFAPILVNATLVAEYVGSEQITLTYQWEKDNVDIAGKTSQTFVPDSPGSYTVSISAEGYSGVSSAAVTVIDDDLSSYLYAFDMLELYNGNIVTDDVNIINATELPGRYYGPVLIYNRDAGNGVRLRATANTNKIYMNGGYNESPQTLQVGDYLGNGVGNNYKVIVGFDTDKINNASDRVTVVFSIESAPTDNVNAVDAESTAMLVNEEGYVLAVKSGIDQDNTDSTTPNPRISFELEADLANDQKVFLINNRSKSHGGLMITAIKVKEDTDYVPVAVSDVAINGYNDGTVINLVAGDTVQLSAVVTPGLADDKSFTWSSDNEDAVTVNADTGLVTAIAGGTANITVTTTDGGHEAFVTVNVKAAPIFSWEAGDTVSNFQPKIPTTINGVPAVSLGTISVYGGGGKMNISNTLLMIGSDVIEPRTTATDTSALGELDLSKKFRVSIAYDGLAIGSSNDYDKNPEPNPAIGLYIGNNSGTAANSVFGSASGQTSWKLSEHAASGTAEWIVDPANFTVHPELLSATYIVIRVDSQGTANISAINIEYVD